MLLEIQRGGGSVKLIFLKESVKDVSLSRYCLGSTKSLTLNYPVLKSRKSLGDQSFFMAAPKLWNELPSEIRDLNSINKFKTAIKTYLFRQAFL